MPETSTPPPFRKLPGFVLNVLGVNRAWLATDHLLVSSSAAAFETYRRYYFREIKALVVRPTATGVLWNVLLGFLLALLGAAVAALLYARPPGKFPVAAAIFGAVWLLIAAALVFHVLRGKTCRVYVQTRAGIEPLASPARVPAAYKLHTALRPLIAAAQADEAPAPAQPPPPPPPASRPTSSIQGGIA
jgi:hypothetical protein